jgi:hypothetical protein
MKYRKLRIAWSVAWCAVAMVSARIADREFHSVHGVPIFSPKWLIVPLPIVLAWLPWFRLQFSLRTLLAIVTIVAIWLGLYAYVAWK